MKHRLLQIDTQAIVGDFPVRFGCEGLQLEFGIGEERRQFEKSTLAIKPQCAALVVAFDAAIDAGNSGHRAECGESQSFKTTVHIPLCKGGRRALPVQFQIKNPAAWCVLGELGADAVVERKISSKPRQGIKIKAVGAGGTGRQAVGSGLQPREFDVGGLDRESIAGG